jgi:hypothetical protein
MSVAKTLFATAATGDADDSGVAVIWFTTHPADDFALKAVSYEQHPMSAVDAEWVEQFFKRSADLVTAHEPQTKGCLLRVEHPGLLDVLKRADAAFRDTESEPVDRSIYDIRPVKEWESSRWPATFDERASSIRPLVNSGRAIKFDTRLRKFAAAGKNALLSKLRQHRPGDSAVGALLHAFVLGVLLGTTRRPACFFTAAKDDPEGSPSSGPFGSYIPGRRPW